MNLRIPRPRPSGMREALEPVLAMNGKRVYLKEIDLTNCNVLFYIQHYKLMSVEQAFERPCLLVVALLNLTPRYHGPPKGAP